MSNTYWQSQYGQQILLDADAHPRRWLDAVGPDVVKFVEDFVAAPVDPTSGEYDPQWTITRVEAGAGESTFAPVDGQNGFARLSTDANENDGLNVQLRGEGFKLTSAARLYFGIRFRVSEDAQCDWFAGLAITDTDVLAGTTDRAGFEKLDGSTSVTALMEKDSTETQVTGVMTIDENVLHTLEFFWDGPSNRMYFYVDNEETDRAASFASVPGDEDLRPTIQFLAGDANARTLDIDWLRVIQIGRAS